jgi:hypothetical protein
LFNALAADIGRYHMKFKGTKKERPELPAADFYADASQTDWGEGPGRC